MDRRTLLADCPAWTPSSSTFLNASADSLDGGCYVVMTDANVIVIIISVLSVFGLFCRMRPACFLICTQLAVLTQVVCSVFYAHSAFAETVLRIVFFWSLTIFLLCSVIRNEVSLRREFMHRKSMQADSMQERQKQQEAIRMCFRQNRRTVGHVLSAASDHPIPIPVHKTHLRGSCW